MAADWYCKIAGAELGPLSSQQLRALAADGRLRPEDEVCQGQGGKWVAANRVKGLLKSSSSEVLVAQPLAEDMPVAAKAPPPHAKKVEPSAVPQAKTVPQPPEVPQAAVPVAKAAAVSVPAPAAMSPPAFNFAGASSHSGPTKGKATPLSPADAAKQRKQQRKKMILASIGGLVALGVVGGVLAFVNPFGSGGKDSSGPSEEMAAALQFKEGELTGESIEDMDLGISGAGNPEHAEKPAGDRWLDAVKEQANAGPVSVRIVSVQIEKPRVNRTMGRPGAPKEDCLVVTLELVNTDPEKKIVHAGWGRTPAIQQVAMNDNHGNPYKVETFPGTVEGQQSNASLYPDEPVQDVLVFERPVPAAEHLRLELPASSLGEKGMLRFQIPKAMIGAEPMARPVAGASKSGPAAGSDDEGEVYQLQAVERAIGMEAAKPDRPADGIDALRRDNPELFPDQM